ncbi:MAG: hypothetical protein OEZ58_04470 [Gammaproteobacteria bacterium]|nr:hypothetical protein [Gammaproteobacteria bacterium]
MYCVRQLQFAVITVSLLLIFACSEHIPPTTIAGPTTETSAEVNGYIIRNNGERVSSNAAPITIKQGHDGLEPSHVRGARIYDDFTIELDQVVAGPNPIVAIATSGPAGITDTDSWRCSQCHGFDYEGGVFSFNNGATNNLLELQDVRGRDEEFVIGLLFNGFDMWDGAAVQNVHNYSALLTPQAMVDVADFVVNEIYDTHMYIRAPSSGSLGDMAEGNAVYNSLIDAAGVSPIVRVDGSGFNCVSCHGVDGLGVAGIDLRASAWNDPFQFLHRTNFGSPRSLAAFPGFTVDVSVMPGLYELILTDGLHFGGPEQAAAAMMVVQMF